MLTTLVFQLMARIPMTSRPHFSSALDNLTTYYKVNQLKANPTKNQVSLFHQERRGWEISTHAKTIDPALNDSCRAVTGCLKPTNVDSLYTFRLELLFLTFGGQSPAVLSTSGKLKTSIIHVMPNNQPPSAWTQERAFFRLLNFCWILRSG